MKGCKHKRRNRIVYVLIISLVYALLPLSASPQALHGGKIYDLLESYYESEFYDNIRQFNYISYSLNPLQKIVDYNYDMSLLSAYIDIAAAWEKHLNEKGYSITGEITYRLGTEALVLIDFEEKKNNSI